MNVKDGATFVISFVGYDIKEVKASAAPITIILANMKVPKRFTYPQSEYDYNSDNLNAAVQRQYSGDDDVNKVMWLLQ